MTDPKQKYAVIFTSKRTEGDNGYSHTAEHMLKLAQSMPGFLGVDSAREDVGVTVSYWESLEAIEAWRNHPAHLAAQQKGRDEWYVTYSLRICRIEKERQYPQQVKREE